MATGCGWPAAPAQTTLRAHVTERVAPGVVYTTFHHPATQANVVTAEFSDWATNCPEYKVTAVQVSPSNGPSEWQESYRELTVSQPPYRRGGRRVMYTSPTKWERSRRVSVEGEGRACGSLTLVASVGSLRDPTAFVRFAAQPREAGAV